MSNHLPECPAPLCDWGDPSAECMGYEDCHHWCCCDALRACEQRVLEDEFSYKGDIDTAYGQGWDEALDAVREAVVILKKHVEFPGQPVNYIHPDFFLAAIDALREEKP